MNLSVITVMFEELKELISKLTNKIDSLSPIQPINEIKPSIDNLFLAHVEKAIKEIPKMDLSVIEQKLIETKESLNSNLLLNKQIIQQIQNLRYDNTHKPPQKHLHVFEIKSSKVAISLIVLVMALLCSFMGNFFQFKKNSQLLDNDIKYRFVKMYNGIDNKNLYKLENVFVYNPDEEIQQKIKLDVEAFERKIEQMQADKERARLKEKKARQLQREADEIRKKNNDQDEK